MSFGFKHVWASRITVVLAIAPLLFGHALHCLFPCTGEVPRFFADRADLPYGSGDEGRENNESPSSDHSCPVCDFVAMSCDVASTFVWHCVLGLVECHEPEPVRSFIVLYRPFEPGRAPPVVS